MTTGWNRCTAVDFNGARCDLMEGHPGQHLVLPDQPTEPQRAPAPPAGPPPAPASQPSGGYNPAGGVIIIGGVLLAVGAFLPWVTAVLPLAGSISRSGMEGGDGPILLGIGALIAFAGVTTLRSAGSRAGLRALLALVGLGALGLVSMEYQSVNGRIASIESDGATAWVGMGIYAMGAGAVATLIGVVALGRDSKPNRRRDH